MDATDIAPSRLDAAKTAPRRFATGLPAHVNPVPATFADAATVLVTPTAPHEPRLTWN